MSGIRRLLDPTVRRTVRIGPVSAQLAPRTVLVILTALTVTVVLAVVSLRVGDLHLTVRTVVEVLLGGGGPRDQLIVLGLRLPRVLLGVLAGAMLALSGAIVQTTTRNGLASPDLLGVTAGASAGAVAVIVVGGAAGDGGMTSLLQGLGTSGAALVGGLLAASIVAVLLRFTSGGGLQTLLFGVGVSAAFSGLTSWMLTAASIDTAARANAWLAGTLNGRGREEVAVATVLLVGIVLVLVPLGPRLAALALGAEVAASLGHPVRRVGGTLLVCAVALAAVSVSVVGPIGFVALVAPHMARLAAGSAAAPLLASALTGSALLLAADLTARLAIAPVLLPTGAVTALIGAPLLIGMLIHAQRGTSR